MIVGTKLIILCHPFLNSFFVTEIAYFINKRLDKPAKKLSPVLNNI